MSEMLPGLEDFVMMVDVPAEVARRAAMILVAMPPVPRAEPAEETSARRASMSATTRIGWASGNFRGFLS